MRLEYGFELSQVEVPRFSVEAVEGIGKLFTLATLVLNVLESKPRVEIVFHGLNPEDPEAKLEAFKEIAGGSATGKDLTYELGKGLHAIHKHFQMLYGAEPGAWYAMDVEFKFDGEPGEVPALFIKQARPHPGWGQQ